ncbi:MAG TPA: hypothetical protein VMD28_10785, partial [Acidimicrobiales bacterium]|nr:hypothetical protein [Acidimicrobiales bacterium]
MPGIVATAIVESACYRGERTSAASMARVRRLFARGHHPGLVATAIVGAITGDRPVVPVGIEAPAGWLWQRLVPSRLGDRLTRTTFCGIQVARAPR